MRTTVIAGVIIAFTAGHAVAQSVAGQPTLAKPPAAKPPIAALKPPQPAKNVATPEIALGG